MRLWDLSSKSCLKIFSHSDYGKFLEHCYFVRGILFLAFKRASTLVVCLLGAAVVYMLFQMPISVIQTGAGSLRTNIFLLFMVYRHFDCIRLENIGRRWQLGIDMTLCLGQS